MMLQLVGSIILLIGTLICLVGGIGLLRLPNFFARTHGGSVTDTLGCLLYTSPSPRDGLLSRMPSSA